MPRCAVLGDPIAHSLSPVLHRAGYAALGLDWTYDAHRVPAGGLAGFLEGLDAQWRGLSLTMPLKREAMALAASTTPRARLAGAANTLVHGSDGWHADNTDLPGAVAAIRERFDGAVTSAVVLGGGATATSTGLALVDLGAREVTIAVRSPERAEETRQAIAAHPSTPVVRVEPLGEGREWDVDVLVSTIPAAAQAPGLVARTLNAPVVFEVLYDPWPTPLAAAVGDRVLVGGLDLLVHQAAIQFELFTGRPAPLAQMRVAGERALADRAGT
ncbi:MAG: shikimate dehydrogenase [Nocardioides sp.]|nr:shikimate dehydrogenase [Nocardioides sp.]